MIMRSVKASAGAERLRHDKARPPHARTEPKRWTTSSVTRVTLDIPTHLFSRDDPHPPHARSLQLLLDARCAIAKQRIPA